MYCNLNGIRKNLIKILWYFFKLKYICYVIWIDFKLFVDEKIWNIGRDCLVVFILLRMI